MIRDLRANSAWFIELWDTYTVTRQISERKTIQSPTVGPVSVECDVLTAPDSDVRIVVYTARRAAWTPRSSTCSALPASN